MVGRALFFITIATLMVLTGCVDESTVIEVKKDGSGTIVSTLYMTQVMQEMMKQMAEGMGGKADAKMKNPLLDDAEEYRKKTTSMGEGVTFVSAKEIRKADGTTGAQVIYAFKDINRLRVNSEPDTPAGGPEDASAPGGRSSEKKEDWVTFEFVKGATPKLTIKMPKRDKGRETDKAGEATPPQEEMPPAEQMAIIKQFFDGFHMQLMVTVDGEITNTNASYVEKDEKTGRKQRVTLIDMELGKLIKDETSLKKLAAMGQIDDMATAREKLKDIPGLKFETADKVEIEFR